VHDACWCYGGEQLPGPTLEEVSLEAEVRLEREVDVDMVVNAPAAAAAQRGGQELAARAPLRVQATKSVPVGASWEGNEVVSHE
jgi:hypothetical protein